MEYFVLFILLIIFLKLYIQIAKHFNIIDKPNDRSSHDSITIRGGGIIFPIGILIWFIFSGFQYPMFFLGLAIISIISFLDDIAQLSNRLRLSVQLLCMLLILSEIGFELLPWWVWIIIWIVTTGIINAFNFMDGINGITGGYSLSVLSGIWLVNNYQIAFISNELIYYTAISIAIFGFFNFRKKAVFFAGDVGSISIAFILIFMLLKLIIQSGNPLYLLFLSIYGVDSVLTIIYRLWNKENIFEAHRKHLYQLMANEMKISHLLIATGYSVLQFIICLIIYLLLANHPTNSSNLIIGFCLTGILILLFIGVRMQIKHKLALISKDIYSI